MSIEAETPEQVNSLSDIAQLLQPGKPPEAEAQPPAAAAEDAPQPDFTGSPDEPPAAPEGEQAAGGEDDEPPAIDYDLEIPIGGSDAEVQTLGSLKDFYKEHKGWQADRDTWNVQRIEQENQQLLARQHLTAMAERLAKVDPKLLEMAHGQMKVDMQREQAQLLEIRPEWADPAKKEAARNMHVGLLQEYGLDREYAAITDHRIIKLIDDYAVIKRQRDQAREQLQKSELTKGQKPKAQSVSKADAKRSMVNRAKGGSQTDKIAAISTLIGE